MALILFHLFTYILNNDKQLLIGIPVMSSLHIILCSPLFISLISNDLIFRKYFKQYNHTDDKTKTQLLIYLNQIKPPKACIRLNHTQIIAPHRRITTSTQIQLTQLLKEICSRWNMQEQHWQHNKGGLITSLEPNRFMKTWNPVHWVG